MIPSDNSFGTLRKVMSYSEIAVRSSTFFSDLEHFMLFFHMSNIPFIGLFFGMFFIMFSIIGFMFYIIGFKFSIIGFKFSIIGFMFLHMFFIIGQSDFMFFIIGHFLLYFFSQKFSLESPENYLNKF